MALCTCNGERYLAQQLHSIGAQTLLPAEVVLSDDASTDQTLHIAQSIFNMARQAHSDLPQIEFVPLLNRLPLGVTRNFEQAMRATRGELIALCDQDDIWHTGRLARMALEFSRRPKLLLLHSNARLVDGNGADLGHTLFDALGITANEIAQVRSGHAVEALLRRNLVTGATALVRRSLLKQALPFPPEWLHDEWLAMVAAIASEVTDDPISATTVQGMQDTVSQPASSKRGHALSLDLLKAAWVDYRQHAGNQVGVRRLNLWDKLQKLVGPRGDTGPIHIKKMEVLLQRLDALTTTLPMARREDLKNIIQAKLAHQRFRTQLPAHRWQRLVPVLRAAAQGHYQRFDRGAATVARDLLGAA